MKTGKLSKAEKFYIQENAEVLSLKQICKDLDRSEKAVVNHLKRVAKKDQDNKSPKGKGAVDKLLGKNEKYGSVVLTEAAAERADESRKEKTQRGRKLKDNIFKTKPK